MILPNRYKLSDVGQPWASEINVTASGPAAVVEAPADENWFTTFAKGVSTIAPGAAAIIASLSGPPAPAVPMTMLPSGQLVPTSSIALAPAPSAFESNLPLIIGGVFAAGALVLFLTRKPSSRVRARR